MAVVGIDVPSENTPDLRECFMPVQDIHENLISAEEVRVEKVAVLGHLIFGMGIVTRVEMVLVDAVYPCFKTFDEI